MWENCHDYDPEIEAQVGNPKPTPQVDLDRLDALRQMASRFYAVRPSTLTNNADMARKWAEELYNAYLNLSAELRTLRARVAELEDDSEALEDGTRAYLDLTAERDNATRMAMLREALGTRDVHGDIEGIERLKAERDQLRAERDAARDEAAGLRGALEEIKSEASVDISELDGNEGTCICCFCGGSWDPSMQPDHKQECPAATAAAALARTPAQHRARIVAAGLREVANRLFDRNGETEEKAAWEELIHEAERLEKEAGNG